MIDAGRGPWLAVTTGHHGEGGIDGSHWLLTTYSIHHVGPGLLHPDGPGPSIVCQGHSCLRSAVLHSPFSRR